MATRFENSSKVAIDCLKAPGWPYGTTKDQPVSAIPSTGSDTRSKMCDIRPNTLASPTHHA